MNYDVIKVYLNLETTIFDTCEMMFLRKYLPVYNLKILTNLKQKMQNRQQRYIIMEKEVTLIQ